MEEKRPYVVPTSSRYQAVDIGDRVHEIVRAPEIGSWWERQTWKQLVIGALIVVGVAVSWAGATQFSKSALSDKPSTFYAPYFMVWYSTNFMMLCYPVYVLYALVLNLLRKEDANTSLKEIHNEAMLVFGEAGFTLKSFIIRVSPFTILWVAANYTYSQALGHISASETAAIFSSNPACVCILGWLILRDKFVLFRIAAIVLATVGIFLMAYDNGFKGFTLVGVALAAIASVVAALYKVGFKKLIGDATLGQVSVFMTALGVQNILVNIVPSAMFIVFKLETVDWTQVPWSIISGTALLSLVFNFLINFGIALTHPLFISIGLFLGMPLSAGFDLLYRDITMSMMMIIGSALILASFLILLIPADWHKRSEPTAIAESRLNSPSTVTAEESFHKA